MTSEPTRTPLQQLANLSALFSHSSPPAPSSSGHGSNSHSDGESTDTDTDSGSDYSDSSEDDLVNTDDKEEEEEEGDDYDADYNDTGVDDTDEGWTDELRTVKPHAFRPSPPSSAKSAALNACQTALDFFYLIIPPAFITHMVQQTNLYAQQRAERRKENGRRRSHRLQQSDTAPWSAVTDSEMLAFLGCIMYMAKVKMTRSATIGSRSYPINRSFQIASHAIDF